METRYIPGTDVDYVAFIKELKDKATLTNIDGHQRWVVKEDDGTEYIARPSSAQ